MSDKDTGGNFLIAALGASAGGLEALERFFRHMPADSGIAFVVVQHLAPDRPTALPEILARFTTMPVEQVQDKTIIRPDRVSIIPPNATLTIRNGVLRVSAPVEDRGLRTPIDSLFSSLAEDRGENAVCILLSGAGTDGTLGLRAIKEHGGMAMAQALETARYDAMIRSAIGTGLVDHVLPVEAMPAKLLDYAAHLGELNGKPNQIGDQIATQLSKIHDLIKRRAEHDFSQYKKNTIIRRTERRMKAAQIESVEEYVKLLEGKPEKVDRLMKDLLIGVTQFFRDPETFQALGRDVIPKLFEGKGERDTVRACIIGCASGEEAYSIGILLCEHASTLRESPKVQIFATDIDERGLEMARKGRYPVSVAEHVSRERLERFFTKEDGTYQVKRNLREICIFSNHSFIKDPPFSRLDLICCRNVMIYLEADLQQKLFPLFHYALRSGGYLLLGPSESATSHRELFRTADKKHRIFQRKDTMPRPQVTFPLADLRRPPETSGFQQNRQVPDEQNLLRQIERLILQKYKPACIAVRENGDAVYFSGRTGRYLEQPSGALDFNVVNMARDGLRIPLRTALHKAVSTRERAIQEDISVQVNGGMSPVDLSVEPITEFPSANLYMIVFEDAVSGVARQQAESSNSDANTDEIIRHLEGELRSSQEHTQAMYEELETSNEELRSANEEYQSTNEELETSKEEIQSFNEELETVNTELNRKVAELDHSNSDLQNLLNSTQIATIFLGADFRIKNFTPSAGTVFRLIAGDIGRPITDLAARLSGADLVTEISEVLRTLTPSERQMSGTPGQHFQMRILPYRTIHNLIDGVVLTFTDVSRLREAEELARRIVDTVREPLLVLDGDLRVMAASKSFYETFQVSAKETLTKGLYALGSMQWNIPELQTLLSEVLPANKAVVDFAVRHAFPDIGQKTMLLNARRIEQQNGKAPLILLAIEDVTERTRLEESQAQLSAIVESSEDAILSSDLDGVIRTWNRGAERLLGYRAEEVIGKPVSTLAAIEHAEEIADMLQRLFRGERIEHYETSRRTKDGRSIPVSILVSAITDSSGSVIGASKMIHDITARKLSELALRRSEERYRTLFESIDEGFCIIEMIFDDDKQPVDYRFLQVSPSFEKQTGLTDVEGKRIRELAPQHEAYWFEIYGNIALTGEPARFESYAAQFHRWYDVYAFRFGEAEKRHVAVLFNDVTERKRTQETLQTMNLDLQHFAYAASHDLQEPLRMVMSYTQLLARQYRGKLDGQADQFIAYAVQGAERMETLLRDLREYWSVNEKKDIEPVPVDCEQLLSKVLDVLAASILESRGHVTHDPLPTVMAEETPVLLLFQNLIGNAVKYRRAGVPPEVHISAERSGEKWSFSVRDNGIGIEAQHVGKIFAPFKRLHGAEFAGSGIGLAICQRVVERYACQIWVESVYGQGSNFRFTLPTNGETCE